MAVLRPKMGQNHVITCEAKIPSGKAFERHVLGYLERELNLMIWMEESTANSKIFEISGIFFGGGNDEGCHVEFGQTDRRTH